MLFHNLIEHANWLIHIYCNTANRLQSKLSEQDIQLSEQDTKMSEQDIKLSEQAITLCKQDIK